MKLLLLPISGEFRIEEKLDEHLIDDWKFNKNNLKSVHLENTLGTFETIFITLDMLAILL